MKQLKKWSPYLFLALLAVITIFILKNKNKQTPAPVPTTQQQPNSPTNSNDPTAQPNRSTNRERGLNRTPINIKLSKHAKCRMECRHIDQTEINDILQKGKINYNKSDLNGAGDEKYAVEGVTKDNQKIRIIVAQAVRSSTIVTVIDLDTKWDCHCPGD
jgi:Domain of unknown function (DUF4258)